MLAWTALFISARGQSVPSSYTLTDKPTTTISGTDTTIADSELVGKRHVERWSNVAEPTVTWYPSAASAQAAPAMLVLPGGGYRVLATDLEGTEVCAWLNAQGISALLVRYRVPTGPPHTEALVDARASLALLVAHAAEWHVDLAHVGVIGFSAGAHLAGRLASAAPGTLKAMILIYPAYFAGTTPDVAAVSFSSATPPAFVVQAQDDSIGVRNATTIFERLTALHVPAELHLYATGGHGYGLRDTGAPVNRWPELAAVWLARQGFAPALGKAAPR